jgi:lipopolysaccharide biosynthesis glycosyltransferase
MSSGRMEIHMEKIHISLTTTDSYAQHAGAMIASLLYNKKSANPIAIHIISDGLTKINSSNLEEITNKYNTAIKFYVVDLKLFEGIHTNHLHNSVYMRTKISDILPDEIEKVLYLDVDMVIRKDITELWEINIDDYYLAAVEDCVERITDHNPLFDSIRPRLGIPETESYFNSGLLLINLNKWRAYDIGHKVIEFAKNNPDKLAFADQDALNAILWGKWLHLNAKWNIMHINGTYGDLRRNKITLEIIEGIKDPGIIHFAGPVKPWQFGCTHYDVDEYWKYLKMTPWQGYSKDTLIGFNEWLYIVFRYFKLFVAKSKKHSILLGKVTKDLLKNKLSSVL